MKTISHTVAVLLFSGTACARSEPPGARSITEAQVHRVGANVTTPNDAADLGIAVSGSSIPIVDAGAPAQPIPASDADTPIANNTFELVDEAGQPKPQTNDKPDVDGPQFQARIAKLCEAIIKGDPERAHDAFFPLVAYRQVKGIENPDRDYRLRLLRNFDRDILNNHRRVSKRPAPVTCSGLKIPDGQARWMKPGSEYNRIGYFRVLRSQLGLVDATGSTFSLEVTSLISWRGEWYIVHLNGFE